MSQIQGEEQIGHLGSNEKGQFQKDRRTISEGYNLINRAKLWYPYAKTPIPGKPSKSGLIWVWHKDNLYLMWTSPETPTRTHYMFQMDRWLGPRQINKPWINWISSVIFCFLLFFSWQNMNLILCAISHLLLSLIISATYKKNREREREIRWNLKDDSILLQKHNS